MKIVSQTWKPLSKTKSKTVRTSTCGKTRQWIMVCTLTQKSDWRHENIRVQKGKAMDNDLNLDPEI